MQRRWYDVILMLYACWEGLCYRLASGRSWVRGCLVLIEKGFRPLVHLAHTDLSSVECKVDIVRCLMADNGTKCTNVRSWHICRCLHVPQMLGRVKNLHNSNNLFAYCCSLGVTIFAFFLNKQHYKLRSSVIKIMLFVHIFKDVWRKQNKLQPRLP